MAAHLGDVLPLVLHNIDTTTPGVLNNQCGADFVKTQQKIPPSLASVLKSDEYGAQFGLASCQYALQIV